MSDENQKVPQSSGGKSAPQTGVWGKQSYGLEKILKGVAAMPGHLGSYVIDPQGKVVAASANSKVAPAEVVKPLFDVSNEGRRALKEMGLGELQQVQIDGPWGSVFMDQLGGNLLICLGDGAAKGEAAHGRIEHIIDDNSE